MSVKERIKELEDLAKKRFKDNGGFNIEDYLTTDEYDELEENLEAENKELINSKDSFIVP